MLVYHPLYDAYHCVFRILLISERLGSVPVEMVRLLDFYILFPARITKIRLPADLSYGRPLASRQFNPYHDVSNPQSVFRDLTVIQDAALHCIVAADLIDKVRFEEGIVTRTGRGLPEDIARRLREYCDERTEILDFILERLSTVQIYGDDGLKDRTGLMEYRYDRIS